MSAYYTVCMYESRLGRDDVVILVLWVTLVVHCLESRGGVFILILCRGVFLRSV